jgi:hypothetical protein
MRLVLSKKEADGSTSSLVIHQRCLDEPISELLAKMEKDGWSLKGSPIRGQLKKPEEAKK